MTDSLVYEVDGPTYLDRQNRTKAHIALLSTPGTKVDVEEWGRALAALQGEVDPLPLVVGVRYRIRMLGGEPAAVHRHYRDDAGAVHGIDFPYVAVPEYVELEGIFLERRAGPLETGMILFDVAGRGLAMLADMDVLRLEEIR